MEGWRKILNSRGLFKSKRVSGRNFHSDINGAWNIGRKILPELFNTNTITIEEMIKSPLSLKGNHDLRRLKNRVNGFYNQFASHEFTKFKTTNVLASV